MPVDSPPFGNAVRSFGTSAWILFGSQPSAPATARTCSIDRGSWIQRGLNSMSRSASSSGEYTSWIRIGSCGANSSVIISRVYAANAATSGTCE
jgi:hypothetical protein